MNLILWILQIVLAFIFLMAGATKMLQSKEKLLKNMPWVNDFSAAVVVVIGMLEVLGAVGLLLPKILDMYVSLVPIAAAGLALIMIGAMLTHARRKESKMVVMNLLLFVMAAFTALAGFLNW